MKRESEAALAVAAAPMKRQDVTDLIAFRKVTQEVVAGLMPPRHH